MLVSWSRPNDFNEWSASGFSIVVSAIDTFGNTQSITLTNNETSHIFINLSRGTQYKASVHYVNNYGDGPSLESGFTSLSCVPDAPILFNPLIFVDSSCTITWAPPLFDGQSEITSYKVYQQGVGLLTTITDTSVLNYTVSGLTNGITYSFYVVATNAIGDSPSSTVASGFPSGPAQISSMSAGGKIVSFSVMPNGRQITGITVMAFDNDPQISETGSFLQHVSNISSDITGTMNFNVAFNQFTSSVQFALVIVEQNQSSFYRIWQVSSNASG
jgi:hypothetical protein